MINPRFHVVRVVTAVLTTATVFGCSSTRQADDASRRDSIATIIPASPPNAAMPAPGMPGDASMKSMAMTGDADHDFLRMMSDHHKGLIVLAHMTKDRKGGGPAVADARKLDAEQDVELDEMMTMLEKGYKDAYAPTVMPAHQAMADGLETKSGKEYDRVFLQDVITHHEEAIRMIDEYLPKAGKPAIKQMAERMKTVQSKEISQMKRQLAALGA